MAAPGLIPQIENAPGNLVRFSGRSTSASGYRIGSHKYMLSDAQTGKIVLMVRDGR